MVVTDKSKNRNTVLPEDLELDYPFQTMYYHKILNLLPFELLLSTLSS